MKKSSSSQDSFMTLDQLTNKQWADIHEIARVMLEQNQHGANQFKCTIHAFVLWLGEQTFDLAIEADATEEPHDLH